jgi:NADH:ubiquinone oxidoreductase subunit 6 (chain J)
VYAAISLGILGLSIASLIAVFFSPLYGVLHVIIYVGATVTFIVVVGVMLRGAEVPRASNWKALLASVLSFLFLTGLLITIASKVPPQQSSLDLVNITSTILRDYYFPVIILIIALAATLIEAITIARRD